MKDTKKETPFFARFLEGQEFPQVKTNIKAGIDPTSKLRDQINETQKYPSDGDET
ncbi:MAG TPA: microviridin/marinostatin family tricyclic proteinase inhibitor [Blastocatellia bacterium]|nr:microviridin/marinostatin family tricyclic proteinase inhibitor [Blastocatellia bacterium]